MVSISLAIIFYAFPAFVHLTVPALGWTSQSKQHTPVSSVDGVALSRRCAIWTATTMTGIATGYPSPAIAETTGAEVRGIGVTPFNSLMFQYRGADSDDGVVKASDLNEESISYDDFISLMKKGDVEFVEFMAPDGDKAYATVKGMGKPIRIGEGYPIEKHDGWSSPAFAIRTVKNYGVPYKFTVPALGKSATTT